MQRGLLLARLAVAVGFGEAFYLNRSIAHAAGYSTRDGEGKEVNDEEWRLIKNQVCRFVFLDNDYNYHEIRAQYYRLI